MSALALDLDRLVADTQFGIASGTKGLTALVVMRLVEDGALSLSTAARSVLGADLPLIDERVTIEHLLAHRSGIGDYLDEELDLDLSEYLLPVPAQQLATTEDYLPVLDGHSAKFAPGERFAYSNSGYVVLALIAERVAATPYHDLVRDLVCTPAGMNDTAFLRSDQLPGRAAVGYLQVEGEWRTNVFHLPRRSGARSSRARSSERRRSQRCSGSEAFRARTAATGSASGSRPADARYGSRAATLESASPPSTTRTAS